MHNLYLKALNVLWNSQERRIRAFWRLLVHVLLWVIVSVLLSMIGVPFSKWIFALYPAIREISSQMESFSLQLAAILLVTWGASRFIDRRAFSELGLALDRDWWIDLLFGLALGAMLMTLIFYFEIGVGWISIRERFSVTLEGDIPFAIAILGPIVIFISVGVTEEVLVRGYQLRNMAEGLNFGRRHPATALLLAWIVSSFVFGLLHAGNPNATFISTSLLMLAGLFLGLGLVLTGRLGLPIGLHISWNFFQGNVYGFPVSGNDFSSVTFIAIEQGGPSVWTGGAFGPEAGLIGMGAILIGCALILLWVRARYGRIALYRPYTVYVPRSAELTSMDQLAIGDTDLDR